MTLTCPAEEALDAQAATEIIDSLQAVLGDVSALRALPPDQRVAWVRTQAGERVREKLAADAQAQLTEAMDAYAAAAFRAKAFEQIAVPAFKNASATGGQVDWALLEARMGSEVDTRTRAYGAAVAGLTIGWDSLEAFSNEGAQAGFSKLAAGVFEAVADAYIPGWGWFKLGTTLVESLGNYVIAYATDTATEGMLEDLFDKGSNPQGFAQLLRTVPLAELYAKIDDGWELVAYGRAWNGQGTDAGDEAMKERLKDAVYNLKAGVAHREALQRQQDEALRAKFQPYLDAAAQSEIRLRDVATRIRTDGEPYLGRVRAFEQQVSSLAEQQAEQEAAVYSEQAAPAAGDLLPYTPLNRDSVITLYETAYAMVTAEPGGVFDYEALSEALAAANSYRWEIVDGQTEPPNGPGKTEWLAHRTADRAALEREIAVVTHQADQRAEQLAEVLRGRVLQLRAHLQEARVHLEDGLASLENDALENLRLPNTLVRYSQGDFTEDWLLSGPFHFDVMGYWIAPADNYAQMAEYRAQLQADRDDLRAYHARLTQLYDAYQAVVDEADRTMRESVANGCQDFQQLDYGSDDWLFTWGMTNHYAARMYAVTDELPLVASAVKREWLVNRFDSDRAITRIETRMAELQDDYDRAQLAQRLAQILLLLHEKLSPFAVDRAPDAGFALLGRVHGIVDYRQPIEATDLAAFASRLQPVWDASQTRLELLGRHPDLVDAVSRDALLKYGADLDVYLSLLDGDAQERSLAPDRAAQLMASLQQASAGLLPVLHEMNPEYYESTLAGLENTLNIAQLYLSRARTATSPVYALMENDLRVFVPTVTLGIQQTIEEYGRILPLYSQTLPRVTSTAQQFDGGVGQPLHIALEVDPPGGTFSSLTLPAGVSLDPQTGTLSGAPTQAGQISALINYTAPSGFTSGILIDLNLGEPLPTRQTIRRSEGAAMLTLEGTPGLELTVQARDALAPAERWQTLQTVTLGTEPLEWSDSAGGESRFYRSVWVP